MSQLEITLSFVRERHRDFLNGISRLYETLVEMAYLKSSDVVWPNTPSTLDQDSSRRIGFPVNLVLLAGLVPFPHPEFIASLDGSEASGCRMMVAPGTQILNYQDTEDLFNTALLLHE